MDSGSIIADLANRSGQCAIAGLLQQYGIDVPIGAVTLVCSVISLAGRLVASFALEIPPEYVFRTPVSGCASPIQNMEQSLIVSSSGPFATIAISSSVVKNGDSALNGRSRCPGLAHLLRLALCNTVALVIQSLLICCTLLPIFATRMFTHLAEHGKHCIAKYLVMCNNTEFQATTHMDVACTKYDNVLEYGKLIGGAIHNLHL